MFIENTMRPADSRPYEGMVEEEYEEDVEASDIPPRVSFWRRLAEHTKHLKHVLERELSQL